MDSATAAHLDAWIKSAIQEPHQQEALDQMLAFLAEHEDMPGDRSWTEVARMAGVAAYKNSLENACVLNAADSWERVGQYADEAEARLDEGEYKLAGFKTQVRPASGNQPITLWIKGNQMFPRGVSNASMGAMEAWTRRLVDREKLLREAGQDLALASIEWDNLSSDVQIALQDELGKYGPNGQMRNEAVERMNRRMERMHERLSPVADGLRRGAEKFS